MFKPNKVNRNAIISIAVLLMMISVLAAMKKMSTYEPRPIRITTVADKSIFDLENDQRCVPGPSAEASAYTTGLTPGGICGAQQLVSDIASYGIEDGIGGSLI